MPRTLKQVRPRSPQVGPLTLHVGRNTVVGVGRTTTSGGQASHVIKRLSKAGGQFELASNIVVRRRRRVTIPDFHHFMRASERTTKAAWVNLLGVHGLLSGINKCFNGTFLVFSRVITLVHTMRNVRSLARYQHSYSNTRLIRTMQNAVRYNGNSKRKDTVLNYTHFAQGEPYHVKGGS